MMFHFSLVHKLQTPVTGEKGAALQTISHNISGVMFFSFSCQIYPASVVFVRPSGLSKLCLWAANLFLKVFAVSPTYCLTSLPPLTVALYTRFSVVHFPGNGQLSGFWQLHLGGEFASSSFKIFLLWLETSALRFGRHLYDNLTFLLLISGCSADPITWPSFYWSAGVVLTLTYIGNYKK